MSDVAFSELEVGKMSSRRGIIALMGSGELTSTMVEVHKELLAGLSGGARAVFLDTPAGFQLNADDLSNRAKTYFVERVLYPMEVASFKSKSAQEPLVAEQACQTMRDAGYILIGPGSPTYAVKQWMETPIPEIFIDVIERGGCLVAASAAALTVGRHTLPVYEIYKVGEDLHWAAGIDILKHFGFDLVVVPHWNNAEGGTHDTRYCYMGASRFQRLESLLPEGCGVLGLDEHTACLIDLARDEAMVKGIGRVVWRRGGQEVSFNAGEHFPLAVLRGSAGDGVPPQAEPLPCAAPSPVASEGSGFWGKVQSAEGLFRKGVEQVAPRDIVVALLDLDRILWEAHTDLESPEFISQGRERFREMIVRLGTLLASLPRSRTECLEPLVRAVLDARSRYRQAKQWHEADVVREVLAAANIVIEDTDRGSQWRLK